MLVLEGFSLQCSVMFKIILLYRPPNSTLTEDEILIDNLFDLCLSNTHLILLGDFNLDVNWAQGKANNINSRKFLELFECCGLVQQVEEPTRGDVILDIILTSAPILDNVSVLPPFVSSDHNLISFEIQTAFIKPRKVPLPNFNKADYIGLSSYFFSIDWWNTFHGYLSVDDVYKTFCRVIYSGLARHVPFDPVEKPKPFYPRHILNLASQKMRLFNMFPNPLSQPHYKRVCSQLD